MSPAPNAAARKHTIGRYRRALLTSLQQGFSNVGNANMSGGNMIETVLSPTGSDVGFASLKPTNIGEKYD